MIVFLCVIWPLAIALFFKAPSELAPGEMRNPVTAFYLPTMALQLFIFCLIILVCRDEKSSLIKLGFRNFSFLHILYAIIFLFASRIVLRAIRDILGGFSFFKFPATTDLLPHSAIEKIIWALLCIVVAFNEESAFRGYLITRLTKITKSSVLAVFIACAGFAAGHLYQGSGRVVMIFVYGLMFAVLYLSTRSLWPCVIAHFINNAIVIISGSVFIIPPFW